jgi:hypothetical protein
MVNVCIPLNHGSRVNSRRRFLVGFTYENRVSFPSANNCRCTLWRVIWNRREICVTGVPSISILFCVKGVIRIRVILVQILAQRRSGQNLPWEGK